MTHSITGGLRSAKFLLLFTVLTVFSCKKETSTSSTNEPGAVLKSTAIQATNRYFIFPNGNSLSNAAVNAVAQKGGSVLRNYNSSLGFVIATSNSANFKTQMQTVSGVRAVIQDIRFKCLDQDPKKAAKNTALPPNATNSNPFYNWQWNMNAINVEPAWNAGYKGAGARVAVIDNGFELNHPDMVGRFNVGLGMNFVVGETLQFQQNPAYDPNDPSTEFYFSHGTHVSGIIAANDNNEGVIGVAPLAEIIPIKALSDKGWGYFSDLMAGVIYAADVNADIANMSFIGYVPIGLPQYANEVAELVNAFQKAINWGTQHGVTYIAAAGNDGFNPSLDMQWKALPAALANVSTVSATGPLSWGVDPTTNLDVPAFYTNYGLNYVTLSAPGGNIDFSLFPNWPGVLDFVLSPANDNQYWFAIGTSMAAPHVSGVAALIVSKFGHLTPAQMRSKLQQSANDLGTPGKDQWFGHGRVNAGNAVAN